ncbi:MAG TPA: cysteine--tRNA ligase, partial [Chloroflexota bacterium]|nr:cysteine--tRNA ligase [Chloroflexota bacterium]
MTAPDEEQRLPLRLYNTLTRRVEEFKPLRPPQVLMYTCGPTVYHFTHIGNMRSFLTSDILHRVLMYNGYQVSLAKNITDVGHLRDEVAESGADRIEAAAAEEHKSPEEIAEFYTQRFIEDEARLNILPPTHRPRATAYIPEMIDLASRLIDKGYAYEVGGNVYFDVHKFPSYGRLS